tara:strand:+ start:701 stop:1225 length:525 start_codon:yes stop_codon:yes gene_type:complete
MLGVVLLAGAVGGVAWGLRVWRLGQGVAAAVGQGGKRHVNGTEFDDSAFIARFAGATDCTEHYVEWDSAVLSHTDVTALAVAVAHAKAVFDFCGTLGDDNASAERARASGAHVCVKFVAAGIEAAKAGVCVPEKSAMLEVALSVYHHEQFAGLGVEGLWDVLLPEISQLAGGAL